MSTPRRLFATSLVAGTLALANVSCYSEGASNDILTLVKLDPKVLPIAIEEDADPKDVIYKARSVYKPATAVLFPEKKDYRLVLRGKREGAALRTVLQRDFLATEYEHHVRIGFDPDRTDGLVDGQSLLFFELVLDTAAGGVPAVRRLEAVYNVAITGLTVRASDGTSTLGTPLNFFGRSELVLQIRLEGGTLFLEGGPTTGEFVNQYTPSVIYSEVPAVEGSTRQSLAWGATGLGKKGSVYLNQLTLGSFLPDIGAVETGVALDIQAAYVDAMNAAFGGDLAAAAASIEAARQQVHDIVIGLQAAVDGSTLDAITQGKLALKNAGKALKATTRGKAIADKLLAKGASKTKPVNKKGRQTLRWLELAFAQVAGFRSNKTQQLFKSGFLPFGS